MRRELAYAQAFGIACLVLIASGCREEDRSTASKPVPVGAIAPLSGDTAQYGKALQNGMLLALDEVNAAARSDGRRELALIFEDSRGNATAGVNAFRKLVDFNKTPIVLGAMFSKITMAIAPIAEEEHVVLLSPTSSDVALSDAGDYVFRIYPSDTYDGDYLARFMVSEPDIVRVAVLYLTTSSTTAIADVFKASYTKAGGTVVLAEGHAEQTKDFRTVLEKVDRAKPDAVLLCSYLNEMALMLRQARELGYDFRFVAISTIYDEKIFELAGSSANGVIFSTAVYDAESPDSLTKAFVEKFKGKSGESPNIWAAYGYDVVRVAGEAVRNSDGTADGIKKALYSIKDFPGVTGTVTFDQNGDVAKSLRMMVIKDQRFVPLND